MKNRVKNVLCLIFAICMTLSLIGCGCRKETEKDGATDSTKEVAETVTDKQLIEEVVIAFADNLFKQDIEKIIPLTKPNSEVREMFEERTAVPHNPLEAFQERYVQNGGDIKDFDNFKVAKNFSIEIDDNIAIVTVDTIALGGSAGEFSIEAEVTVDRIETKAYKNENGGFVIATSEYCGEEEVRFRNSYLSYHENTLQLEKIDGTWYISELIDVY